MYCPREMFIYKPNKIKMYYTQFAACVCCTFSKFRNISVDFLFIFHGEVFIETRGMSRLNRCITGYCMVVARKSLDLEIPQIYCFHRKGPRLSFKKAI